MFRLISPAPAALAALSALALTAPRAAHAQANLTFTGGSGSPVTLTLATPVTYSVTASGGGPFFIFDAVGGPTLNLAPATGTITYNINGGISRTISTVSNGGSGFSITPDDLYLFGAQPGVTNGSTVTLTAGTLTTTSSVASAHPANGSFTTFLTDDFGSKISNNGVSAPATVAQAKLAFTGGSGSPLTLTLATPVVYTVTASGGGPFFIFDAVGGSSLNLASATGTITYNINGGVSRTISTVSRNGSGFSITPDDLYFFGSQPGVTIGDIVTLTAGTLTTTSNVADLRPGDGYFTTFLTDDFGSKISNNGAAAPEPGTLPLVGMGLVSGLGTLGVARKKRKNVAQ